MGEMYQSLCLFVKDYYSLSSHSDDKAIAV